MGIATHQVEVDGGHRVLEESQWQEIRLLLAVGQVGRVNGLREHADRRRTLAGPSACDLPSQLLESGSDAVRSIGIIGNGECGMGEELLWGQDSTGNICPECLGELAGDERVCWVVQTQFQTSSNQWLLRHAQLVATRQRHYRVDAKAAPATQDVVKRVLEFFEVAAEES